MNVAKHNFIDQMYPINYLKKKDYSKVLFYQHNISITLAELKRLEFGETDFYNKGYNFIRDKIPSSEYAGLDLSEQWKKNDIIYLIIKEHLLEHYQKSLDKKASTKKTYNKAALNKLFNQFQPDSPRRIQENSRTYSSNPLFRQLENIDTITLLESPPSYGIIPFQLFYLANLNPLFQCFNSRDNNLDFVTTYILSREPNSSESLLSNVQSLSYDFGDFFFLKKDIEPIFFNAYSFIQKLKESNIAKYNERNALNEDTMCIIRSFLTVFFAELYDHYFSNTTLKVPCWNELTKTKKASYNKIFEDYFIDYFNRTEIQQRAERIKKIEYDSHAEYLTLYTESFLKILTNLKNSNEGLLHGLSIYWISETIFPLLSISLLISTDAFKKLLLNLKETYSGKSHIRYNKKLQEECLDNLVHLLLKLSLCPNIFNQVEILNYFAPKYEPYSNFNKWYDEFNSAIDHYNHSYYPILESSFHSAFDLYCSTNKLEKQKNITDNLPLYVSRKYNEILTSIETTVTNSSSLDTGQKYIIKNFYTEYSNLYEHIKDRLYQRLNNFERREII